jgi:hypothetical protein
VFSLIFSSTPAIAALINPQPDVSEILSSIRNHLHNTCSDDNQFYIDSVAILQSKNNHVMSNPYTMQSPVGRGCVVLYNLGIGLARLASADKLLEASCFDESKALYREVVRTTSDVSLQNRAMLGLEDIRERTPVANHK